MWNTPALQVLHSCGRRTLLEKDLEVIESLGGCEPHDLDESIGSIGDPTPDPERLGVVEDVPSEAHSLDPALHDPLAAVGADVVRQDQEPFPFANRRCRQT
jgi:hypothetical protein